MLIVLPKLEKVFIMETEQNKVFIGNLAFRTDEEKIRELFARFGDIEDVSIPLNRETGRPRGFAFLTFQTPEAAQEALSLDGQEVDGRNIRVNMAQSKSNSERGGGFDRRRSFKKY